MDENDKPKEQLERVFGSLTPREARVLHDRLGISSDETVLKNLGERLDTIRARLREIERRALDRSDDGDDPDDAA